MTSGETYENKHDELKIQFDDLGQQQEATSFGVWIFLATEVLFFGGLFLAYIVYRVTYPETFEKAGQELNLVISTLNTAILLTSSYSMALAVHYVKSNQKKKAAFSLAGTWLLGFSFLLLKGYEYYDDIQKNLVPGPSVHYSGPNPGIARVFYFIYFTMTGVHGVHVFIGLCILTIVFVKTVRDRYSSQYFSPVEGIGLYWHFVDLIWIFLYPLLYLLRSP